MSSLTADTVSNILQIVSDLKGENSTNSDAMRIRAVSRAERDWAKRNYWRVHLLVDQTAGTGDGTTTNFTIGSSTYPMRMKGLAAVYVGGTTEDNRLAVVDRLEYNNQVTNDASAKVAYEWYDVANDVWKVKVNPAPSTGSVVYYSYFWEPPKRTATTDVVVCPNLYIIARLSLADIYEFEEELDKRDEQLQIAEQLIAELRGTETAPAPGQLYTFGALQNVNRMRGIGTY